MFPYLPRVPLVCCHHLLGWFAGLDDVLGRVERMEQGLPGTVPHASQTSDTMAMRRTSVSPEGESVERRALK